MAATNGSGKVVAVLEEDYFFLGRIGPTLKAAGLEMKPVVASEDLPEGLAGILVDLDGPWESVVDPLVTSGVEVVGFGPHVDGALMKRARKAGITRVMAKSKFVKELPVIAERWARGESLQR